MPDKDLHLLIGLTAKDMNEEVKKIMNTDEPFSPDRVRDQLRKSATKVCRLHKRGDLIETVVQYVASMIANQVGNRPHN